MVPIVSRTATNTDRSNNFNLEIKSGRLHRAFFGIHPPHDNPACEEGLAGYVCSDLSCPAHCREIFEHQRVNCR